MEYHRTKCVFSYVNICRSFRIHFFRILWFDGWVVNPIPFEVDENKDSSD